MIKMLANLHQRFFEKMALLNFIPLLALRLYLVPIYWQAGTRKWMAIDNTIAWFGSAEWGLGLPFPTLMAYLASLTEIAGAILLLVGFAVRWISIPLMVVMLVAAFLVHWDNGWLIIAHQGSEPAIRLGNFLEWLSQNYPIRHEFVTELGKPVMLNNGIEFAITYLIMLLTLFFYGGGRYFSLDYWIRRYTEK